jgi:putative ABC transport system permease protein
MKPLNPLNYLKNNVKKTLPVFVSVTVGVLLIYVFSLFAATTNKMIRIATFDVTDKYNIVYTKDGTSLPQSFLDGLNDTKSVIPVQMNLSGLAYYRGGMGGTTMLTLNLFEDNTRALFDSFNIELIEGKFPRNNQNEILVPVEFAMQNGLTVGDYIGNDVSDDCSLYGKYRICGLSQGDVLIAVTCQPDSNTKEQIMSSGVMYQIDSLSAEEQERLISTLPENAITITRDYYEQEFSVTLNSMSLLVYSLTAVMVVILCIALGNLNIILLSNRRDELTMLHSIGFTRRRLFKKLWMESLFVCMGGYLTGVMITMLSVWLLNTFLLIPQGKVLEIIDWNGLVTAFALPSFTSVFSLLPSLISNFRGMKR